MDLNSISLPGLTLIFTRNVNARVGEAVAMPPVEKPVAGRVIDVEAEVINLVKTGEASYRYDAAQAHRARGMGATYNARLELSELPDAATASRKPLLDTWA